MELRAHTVTCRAQQTQLPARLLLLVRRVPALRLLLLLLPLLLLLLLLLPLPLLLLPLLLRHHSHPCWTVPRTWSWTEHRPLSSRSTVQLLSPRSLPVWLKSPSPLQ